MRGQQNIKFQSNGQYKKMVGEYDLEDRGAYWIPSGISHSFRSAVRAV